MSWVATAIAGSAIVGGIFGSKASDSASDAVVDASKLSSQTNLEMFYKNRKDMAPWRIAGRKALNKLIGPNGLMTKGPGDFEKSPGYRFRLKSGENSVKNYLSASGRTTTGPGMKALMEYNQGFASNEYDSFLNRYYESLNPWLSMSGAGQVATTNTAQMGQQTASNVANNQINAGTARASGYINQANSVTGAVQSGMNNYLGYMSIPSYNNNPGVSYLQGTPGFTNSNYTIAANTI